MPGSKRCCKGKGKSKLERKNRKTKTGVVVSNKMQKTVVVEIEKVFAHPFFGKTVRSYQRFKAHVADNKCAIGDLVEIMETRPIARDKKWRVVRILGQGVVRAKDLPKHRIAKVKEAEAVAARGENE